MIGRVRIHGGAAGPLLVVGLIAGVAGACGDLAGPGAWSEFDADLTLRHMDAVLAPLDPGGDFLLGLDLAVVTLEYYGSSAMASAISLRPEAAEGLRRALSGSRSAKATAREGDSRPGPDQEARPRVEALTLPWHVIGETLEWDPVDGYVVRGRSGAPSNGVRFVLYRMDPGSGYPIRPLDIIGYLDLTNEGSVQTETVRVRAVRTSGSNRVIADYRVSFSSFGSYSEGGMETTARGVLGDVGSVDLDLTQRFEWSQSRDRDDLTLDYVYRRGSSTVELDGRASSRFEAFDWETFDFESRVWGGRETTEIDVSIDRNGSLRGYVLNGGRRVVRIDGYDGSPIFERADGGRLDWADREILEQLWTGITDLIWITDWVLVPGDLLVLDG